MTAIHHHRQNPGREKATKRAFILWMAAYAAALLVVAVLHGFGTAPSGIAVDLNGVRTQQARITGEPQSSLAERLPTQPAIFRVDG